MSPRLVVGLALLVPFAAPLPAQRIENLSQGKAVRKAYAPVVQRANRSVVEVIVAGEVRALGTVVAPDLVVTKHSELAPEDPTAGEQPAVTCRQGEKVWVCRRVAFDRTADLALLRVRAARLTPIEWQMTSPAPGAFLATPDGSAVPLGVGVLASAPYRHTRPRAFLGVRFANPTGGPVELAEVIEHGAARAAGLRAGDVVVGFDEQVIEDSQSLRARLGRHQPGDKVEVKVRRGETELAFEVELGNNSTARQTGQENVWGELSKVRSGFQDVLQHDTILKPSACGGPAVDLSGKALGVNIARAGRVETLALPAAAVQQLVASMLRMAEKPKDTTSGK